MTASASEPRERLQRALSGVDPSAPSTTKYSPLEAAVAAFLGLAAGDVAAVTVSKAGNLSVRAEQSTRAQASQVLVAVVTDPGETEAVRRAARERVQERRTRSIMTIVRRAGDDEWDPDWAVQPDEPSPGPLDVLRTTLGTAVTAVVPTRGPAAVGAPAAALPGAVPAAPLELDDRVRRMLRLAVASRPAVMLVGPPGTGKSTLVAELVREVADRPDRFGMTAGHDVSIVTPDESWTSRELVGGDTVDDRGRLRFAPGAVLDALSQDRWLVLDEANRADMDRIFGSLLTWLAGQPVNVGKVSADPGSGQVVLGWASTAQSNVRGAERLRSDSPGNDPVEYLAGTEWRMLGTYNALDAQRVFRFGLALGRRFAHIPVPAPATDGFAAALAPRLAGLDGVLRDTVRDSVVAMYAAHLDSGSAMLGPAVFLDIPAYVAAGAADGSPADQLLAEGYLTSVGTWLARLEEDELDRLAVPMASADVLGQQWAWVRSRLSALR